MAILDIQLLENGLDGNPPFQLFIWTDNTVAEIQVAGYLGTGEFLSFPLSANQMAMVLTTDDTPSWYNLKLETTGLFSLVANSSDVIGNTVVGNFPEFINTTGGMGDSGISPSDSTKTKIVMANGAVIANRIACFTDEAGTVDDNAATAINGGNIQAGLSGTAGTLASFPATVTTGQFTVQATSNSGAFNTVLTNNALGQTTTFRLPDPGAASAGILLSTLTAPDNNANLVRFDTTVGTTALASGAVTLFTGAGAKQYKIVALWLNFAANLAVGDKNLAIGDGTTVYSVIPAASLLTLVNAVWGSTAVPFPTAAALNTSTVAGASLTAAYSGGTTNYTNGATFVISGLLARVV